MFIDENDTLNIQIFYKKLGRHYVAHNKHDFVKLGLTEEEQKQYKTVNVKMRDLTWGLYNDLQELAVYYDDEGVRRFNYKVFRENKLIRLILSWDATMTKDGKTVPVGVNERNIKNLSTEIAEAILAAYDEEMFLDAQEEEK